jgi:hypothetical protein
MFGRIPSLVCVQSTHKSKKERQKRNDPNRSETMQDSVIELRQMNLNCRIADLQKNYPRVKKSENQFIKRYVTIEFPPKHI